MIGELGEPGPDRACRAGAAGGPGRHRRGRGQQSPCRGRVRSCLFLVRSHISRVSRFRPRPARTNCVTTRKTTGQPYSFHQPHGIMTIIWLARHAETARPTVVHGAESDIELGDHGHRQAEAAAAWFRDSRADRGGFVGDAPGDAIRPNPSRCSAECRTRSSRTCTSEWSAPSVRSPARRLMSSGRKRCGGGKLGKLHTPTPAWRASQRIRDRVVPAFERVARRHRGRADRHRRSRCCLQGLAPERAARHKPGGLDAARAGAEPLGERTRPRWPALASRTACSKFRRRCGDANRRATRDQRR